MTKTEAAEALQISERALERAVERRQITPQKVPKSNGGFKWDFSETAVEEYRKALLEKGTHAVPGSSTALARQDALTDAFARIASALESHSPTTPPKAGKVGVVPIADRLVLSLAEASELAGIPRSRLREAIDAKRLKATKDELGRGWRIKRAHLVLWVSKL